MVILFLTHLMPMGWNDASRLATVQSLVEQHTFQIDKTWWFLNYTGDKVFIANHFYSDKPLSHAVLASVPYLILHPLGITIKNDPKIIIFFTTIFISLLPFLIFFWLFYKLAKNKFLDARKNKKLFLIFCLAVGTILLSYTTVVNNHITAASAIGIALLVLYYLPPSKINIFLIGFCLSLSATFDTGGIFILGFFTLHILYLQIRQKDYHSIVFYFLAALIPLISHSIITIPITGDVFPGSMHSEFFNYPNAPFNSQDLTGAGLAVSGFGNWLNYLFNMLFSQTRGFILHNPILWLGLPLTACLFFKFKEKKKKLFCLATVFSTIGIILYYSLFGTYFGGPNYSIRWFLIFIPAILILIFDWVDSEKKYLLVVILCLIAIVPNISATSKVFNYANSGSADKRLFVRAIKSFPVYAGQQAEEWTRIFKKY